ncbi:MAG: S8 family serine peptidase [Ignavibacteria bacterium]|nr:S8 family serine peptidase [Ignavibacteria bacterium]
MKKRKELEKFESVRPSAVRPVLPLPVRMHADVSKSGKGVCIAMIDSDFVQHPDLCKPDNRISAYYDAVEDVYYAIPPVVTPLARHWHGTMTACTAAGNGYLSQGEFSSLAPEANVVLVRTMNEKGRITTEVIVRALQYVKQHAADLGIRVVNISVYADEMDQSLEHPVTKLVEELVTQGIVVVVAVGNNPMIPIRPPGSAPNALGVGGVNDKNTLSDTDSDMYHSTYGVTNLGVQKPDLIAPAIYLPAPVLPDTKTQKEQSALCALDAMNDDMLLSCAPSLLPYTSLPVSLWTSRNVSEIRNAIQECVEANHIASAWYKMVDGTSFAAPIVASIVAQMIEADPTLTPNQVASILKRTAKPLTNTPDLAQGAGVIQQRYALQTVRRTAVKQAAEIN